MEVNFENNLAKCSKLQEDNRKCSFSLREDMEIQKSDILVIENNITKMKQYGVDVEVKIKNKIGFKMLVALLLMVIAGY